MSEEKQPLVSQQQPQPQIIVVNAAPPNYDPYQALEARVNIGGAIAVGGLCIYQTSRGRSAFSIGSGITGVLCGVGLIIGGGVLKSNLDFIAYSYRNQSDNNKASIPFVSVFDKISSYYDYGYNGTTYMDVDNDKEIANAVEVIYAMYLNVVYALIGLGAVYLLGGLISIIVGALVNSKDMIRREKFIKNESNQISQQSENNFQLEKDEVLLSADGVIERQYGWMYTNDETKGEEIMSVITNPFLFDKNTNTYKDFTRCFLKLYQNSKTCWLQLLDVVTLRVFLKVSISGIFFFYEENVINSLEEENKTKQKKKKDDDDNKLILEGINWEGKKQTFCCTLRLKEDLMNLKKKIQEKINFQLKTLIKEYTERKKVLVQDDSSSQSLEYHKYKSSIPCCMLGGENKGNVKEVELIIFDYYIPKPEEFETKFVFPRLKIVKKIPEMEGLLVLDCTMELEMKVYLELDKVVLEILKDETVFLYKFYFGSSVEDFNKINIFFLNFQQEKKNCELIKTLITERNRLKKNFFFEEVEQEEEEDKKKNLEDEKKINKIKSIDQEEKIEKDFSIVESKKVTKEKLIKEEETFTLSDALIKNVEDKNLPDNKSMVNLGDLRDLLQYLSVNGISNKNPMEMEKYSKLFSCLENSNLPPSLSASSSNETLRQHQIFTSQPCLEEATNKKYSPLKVSKFVNDLRKIDIFEKKKTNLQKLSRVENYFNELYKK
ncbi:hypothetical protein HK099_008554 [Clydaea vesicula]|uniref:Transmembrane protein n=1 Tax=Clydaea vesicula TaxID=447962 RepID=A0AAD5U013_9FUNG|nr:hypothetical protein HK099_008554 [Clydaea vesicula]